MMPKRRGWKEGIITQDLKSMGGFTHKKGSTVRYKRYKDRDEDGYWNGNYQWYYIDTDNYNLIRTSELLVDET